MYMNKSGNKEFGIPPLEPLAVKSLVIDAGTAPINLRQTLKNLLVTDMISTSRIQRYRFVYLPLTVNLIMLHMFWFVLQNGSG